MLDTCVLCTTKVQAAHKVSPPDQLDEYEVGCVVCGKYQITTDAWQLFLKMNWGAGDRRFLLSALAKTAPLRGAPTPRFTQQSFRDAQEGRIREPSLVEKREAILRWIEYLSRQEPSSPYGAKVKLDVGNSYAAAWCREPRAGIATEWNFIMERLINGGLVATDGIVAWLTHSGWEHVEKRPKAMGAQGFIAMAFRTDLADVYTALAFGIESAGYKPLRIDRHEYTGGVMDEILAQIRQSRFLVADLTYNRGGVYREEGFALGLDLPTIHTCRADHIDGSEELRVHFDVQHLNLIKWTSENLDELATRLKNRTEATLGRGPL